LEESKALIDVCIAGAKDVYADHTRLAHFADLSAADRKSLRSFYQDHSKLKMSVLNKLSGEEAKALFDWCSLKDHGVAFVMKLLGDFCLEARGVAKNEFDAGEWFLKAAKAGDVMAMSKMDCLERCAKAWVSTDEPSSPG